MNNILNNIRIDDPLHLHLKSKKPVHIIGGIHHDEHEAVSSGRSSEIVLPPLNTHITFLHYTQSYSDQDHLNLHMRYTTTSFGKEPELPEIYDWRFKYPSDPAAVIQKKKLIMPPDNQYLCGSCWAISTASVIGDAFVVAGLVDWRPQISTTWALICYPQGKCNGGNPALLLQDIAKGSGIPSKHCVDYSWCTSHDTCNGQATRHFEAQNLSGLVPKECGCFYGGEQTQHYNYQINKDVKTLAIDEGVTTAANIQSAVKKHILSHGPALTGYFVMKNFSSGYFTKINGGVYLERANYIPGEPLSFSDANASGQNYKGSHAVAIIGWGIAKNIVYDISNGVEKRGDVPYWYCRNSWGPKWGGDNGYFKMAMYPYNKVSQFGKIVDIVDSQGQRHRCGGIITFTVTSPPTPKVFKTLSDKPPQYIQDTDYYRKPEPQALLKPNTNPPVPATDHSSDGANFWIDILLYLLLPACLVFVLVIKTTHSS